MNKSVICIASPKGGTGKSTIAKELAIYMSHTIKTCLIDFDLSHGCQNAFFKIMPTTTIIDWFADYKQKKGIFSPKELDAFYDWNKIQEYLVKPANGNLYILPTSIGSQCYDIQDENFEALLYYLKKFFDCIILDTGNNMESYTLSAINQSDQVFIIASDSNTCINEIQKFRRFMCARNEDLEKFHLIINRYPHISSYSLNMLEDLLHLDIIALIPDIDEVWMLQNAGIPLTESSSNSLRNSLFELFAVVEVLTK